MNEHEYYNALSDRIELPNLRKSMVKYPLSYRMKHKAVYWLVALSIKAVRRLLAMSVRVQQEQWKHLPLEPGYYPKGKSDKS